MKEIQLTQGQFARVDDLWYDVLSLHKWHAQYDPYTKSFYAVRKSGGKRVFMHAVIANTPSGMCTDHINKDTLDNTSKNLRVCTNAENRRNSGRQSNNTSGYKGVTKNGKKWRAQIRVDGALIIVGYYDNVEDAARAYDVAAMQYHKEYARTNFLQEEVMG